MSDMLATILPKSDQLNADDLVGGRFLTIKITKVDIKKGEEQPVAVHFEGDAGKPYKPGLSMRRVMVHVWGDDARAYVGRSMTLYRDDKVIFGALEVGGIRIGHMSHLDRAVTMVLAATRKVKKPYTVQPLAEEEVRPLDESDPIQWLRNLGKLLREASTEPDVVEIAGHSSVLNALAGAPPKTQKNINDMIQEAHDRVRKTDAGSSDAVDDLLDQDKFPS